MSPRAQPGRNGAVTIDEDQVYSLKPADFVFSDIDGDAIAGIELLAVQGGELRRFGSTAIIGSFIPTFDLGALTFIPYENASGPGLGSVTFKVLDHGGTAQGGINKA